MTRGERIASRREVLGLTQRKVAEAADLDVTYYSKIECDRVENPRVDIIERIALALQCTPNDILLNAGEDAGDHGADVFDTVHGGTVSGVKA